MAAWVIVSVQERSENIIAFYRPHRILHVSVRLLFSNLGRPPRKPCDFSYVSLFWKFSFNFDTNIKRKKLLIGRQKYDYFLNAVAINFIRYLRSEPDEDTLRPRAYVLYTQT